MKALHLSALFSLFSILLLSCNRPGVPLNNIGDVSKIDTQISVRNWRLIGPYVDSAECTWDEKKDPELSNKEDSIDYSQFNAYKPFTGDLYSGKFVRFFGREEGVSAKINENNEIYDFADKAAFAIEFNVKQFKGNSFAYMLAKRTSYEKGEPGWSIVMDHELWQINFGKADGEDFIVTGADISEGIWHHISVVCEQKGKHRYIRTYTDGKLNEERMLPDFWGSINSPAPLTIGYLPESKFRPVDFYLNDIRIWNTSIPAESIKKYSDTKISEDHPYYKNLISNWLCTEGEGDLLKNDILKGNDFVVSGEFSWDDVQAPIFSAEGLNAKEYREQATVTQNGDYIDVKKIFHLDAGPTAVYCESFIESNMDQEVAFLMGMEEAAKVWVNNKLCYKDRTKGYLVKNKVAFVVPLKKGRNNVLIKLYSLGSKRFHLDVSSVKYARDNAIGANFYSISNKYLFKEGDSLYLRINNPDFIPVKKAAKLSILNINDSIVLNKRLNSAGQWIVPLKLLKPGIYNARLITDKDTLSHAFVYGDYKNLLNEMMQKARPFTKTDLQKINIETLYKRFNYLDSFGIKNKYDEALERKMGNTAFDLGKIVQALQFKSEAFQHVSGRHLRTFRSKVDEAEDYYMLYIPTKYKKGHKVPLVVMMPYVTKQVPFYTSFRVSDIDRIEYLQMLAEKYGFAIVWPNSRIYDRYNLGSVVTTSTFEAVNDVKKNYSIDKDRVYVYGDCSGGLQALLIANRFPSYFAAVGVEGPEMGAVEVGGGLDPAVTYNGLLKKVENFKNIPVLLMHSQNDQKAPYALSEKLYKDLDSLGGTVILSNMNNPEKAKDYKVGKMIFENLIMNNIFKFFEGKKRRNPDTVTFSTYQLKYHKAYWMSLYDIERNGKASLTAISKGSNEIEIATKNINELAVNVFEVPGIDKNEKVKIVHNNAVVYDNYCRKGSVYIWAKKSSRTAFKKSMFVEGPVNHVFGNSFLVVKGTQGNALSRSYLDAALDTFTNNWKSAYFAGCKIKKDTELSPADIQHNNLILFGTGENNLYSRKVWNYLPLKTNAESVSLKGKNYNGPNVAYTMVYPNPLNPKKYILLVGANSNKIPALMIKDLSLKGWYDYEIWQDSTMVSNGTFNRNWR